MPSPPFFIAQSKSDYKLIALRFAEVRLGRAQARGFSFAD
jgi:hypothetical protein